MNILYIGTPSSFHDIKWMSFFSAQSEFEVYITCEHQHAEKINDHIKDELEEKKITLLPSFSDYSFKHPRKNRVTRKFLQKTIDDLNIDIVHTLFGSPQPIWLNGMKRVKKVITTRGSDVLIAIPKLNESPVKLHYKYLFNRLKKAYREADVVTCTSIPLRNKLQELRFRNDIKYVKTGIDVDVIRNIDILDYLPQELVGKTIVFSPRYMSGVYNMEYQIEAIRKLPLDFMKNVKFVFVKGRQPSEVYFLDIVKNLDSIPNIDYVIYDRIAQEEMWAILKYAKVAFMVPKSDGTPNSALECLAVNTPLIMGDLNYDKQLFENVCLTTKLSDPSMLTELIQQAMISYPNELLEEGQRKIEEFGNRKVEMTKLQEAYYEITK